MRDCRFRYRFHCQLIDNVDNKIYDYFASKILSLIQIEDMKFYKEYKVESGILKILGIVARDEATGYLDETQQDIFESDRCIDELDRIGYVCFRKGRWTWAIEGDSGEELELESHWWHIKIFGTIYGDDNLGEIKKFNTKGWEEII